MGSWGGRKPDVARSGEPGPDRPPRNARPGWRGAAAIVAATALIAAAVVNLPGQASAAGQQLTFEHTVFGANEAIVADGTISYIRECGEDGIGDFFYPVADVYVTAGDLTDELADISGAPNTVFGASGGYFSEVIGYTAPTGSVSAGVFDVVIDECQNGRLDAEDAVFRDAFRVVLPVDVPLLPDAEIEALKARWTEAKVRFEQAHLAYTWLFKLAEKANKGGKSDIAAKLKEFSEKLADVLGGADVHKGALIAIAAMANHYGALALDPPDPGFSMPTRIPSYRTGDAATDDAVMAAGIELGNAAAAEGALAVGLLDALERYQGAGVAGDGEWALAQARAVQSMARLLAGQLSHTEEALAQAGSAVSATTGDFDGMAAEHESLRTAVESTGFSAEQERFLRDLGLDEDQIRQLFVEVVTGDWTSTTLTSAAQDFADLQATADEMPGELLALANAMEPIIASLQADPSVDDSLPVADAGGPYVTSAGSPLTLAGTAASVDAPVTFAWDLDGDGSFDDASGASPTVVFDHAFSGPVGVRATDADGQEAFAYGLVEVAATNLRQSFGSLSPVGTDASVDVGGSQTFSAAATDPDGDPVTITWQVDGEPAGTGADFTYAPTAADAGLHAVSVVTSDGSPRGGSVRHRWLVDVLHPDDDGDGWRADADCDDADPARSPGNIELAGNGIDDDCNPDTGDAFSHPSAVDVPSDSTYLHTWNETAPLPPPPAVVDLGANGFEPGDVLKMTFTEVTPFSYHGCNGPFAPAMGIAVFSRTTEILGHGQRHRVPGAIDAGDDYVTSVTFYAKRPTDIPEDFRVPAGNGFFVKVPPEAAYAMFAVNDSYYSDNCGTLKVTVEELFDGQDPIPPKPPTADAGGPYATTEGGGLTLDASGSTGVEGAIVRYEWDLDGDGAHDDAVGREIDLFFDDDHASVVSVLVTDENGLTATDTASVAVANVAPDVSAGPDARVNQTLVLAPSWFSDAGRGDTHVATVDWGDDTVEAVPLRQDKGSGTVAASHSYSTSGDHQVEICVTDDDEGRGCDSLTVTVASDPAQPTVHVDDAHQLVEGEAHLHQFAFEDDNPDDSHTATVDWGDGKSGAAVVTTDLGAFGIGTASHTYADDGTYPVELRVCDDAGRCASRTLEETVANAPPVVVANPAHTGVTVASSVALDAWELATFSDPGVDDTHTATIDWGDGTSSAGNVREGAGSGAVTASHAFAAAGSYGVEVCVTDDDQATSCDTTTIRVRSAGIAAPPPPPRETVLGTFLIDPAPPAAELPGPTLPATGGDPLPVVFGGIGSLLLGLALVVVAGRRRVRTPA